jgi:hypothetical protein
MRRVHRIAILPGLLLLGLLLLGLTSCATFVQYTDEIVDQRTGRSLLVTAPATAGGFCGFLVGLPADVVALPITFVVYSIQKNNDSINADPISTMLFPSFVLWRTGTLVAVPFDMIEYVFSRLGRPKRTLTEDEQNEIEYEIDLETLPDYPVEPIFPLRGTDSIPDDPAPVASGSAAHGRG